MTTQQLAPVAGSQEVFVEGCIATIAGRAFDIVSGFTKEKFTTDAEGNQVVVAPKRYLRFNVSYPERTLMGDKTQVVMKRVNVTAWEEASTLAELQDLKAGDTVKVSGWLRSNQPWIDRQGQTRYSDNLTLQGIIL